MKFNINYILVALSGILFGGVISGGKLLSTNGFSLIEILLFPSFIALFFFIYSGIKERAVIKTVSKKVFILFILSIVFIQIGQYTPLFLNVQPSIISMLMYTQPLWTILINRYYFKNALKRYEWIAGILVFLGMIILLNPFASQNGYSFSPLGLSLALIAGFALSLWVITSTSLSEKYNFSPNNLAFWGNIAGSIPFLFLFPLVRFLMFGTSFSSQFVFHFDRSFILWIALFGYTLLTWVGALLIFYKGSEKVPSIHSGIILLLEPVTVVLLDIFVLGSTLTWNVLFGALTILGANSYLIYYSALHERKLKEF